MEKQRKLVAMAFIAGLLNVILSAGIAWAGPSFDPHTAEGGLPQCKANLATCNADLTACVQTLGVPRTGQMVSYVEGDDGDHLQEGVMWPTPRFADKGNGTVKDNFTGLVWMQNANFFPQQIWSEALVSCKGLANGSPGLSDGSNIGDWRLPNVRELLSLIDYGSSKDLVLPDNPFVFPDVKVFFPNYWSSTTYAIASSLGWFINLSSGYTFHDTKDLTLFVWCVRNGESSDP